MGPPLAMLRTSTRSCLPAGSPQVVCGGLGHAVWVEHWVGSFYSSLHKKSNGLCKLCGHVAIFLTAKNC